MISLDATTTPYYYYTSVSIATPVSVTPSISDTSDSVIALDVSSNQYQLRKNIQFRNL